MSTAPRVRVASGLRVPRALLLVLLGGLSSCGDETPTVPDFGSLEEAGPTPDVLPAARISFLEDSARAGSGPRFRELWSARADNGERRRLTDRAVLHDVSRYRIAPGDGSIAAEATTRVGGESAVDVWLIGAAGAPTNLTRTRERSPGATQQPNYTDPDWAPDRNRLVLTVVDSAGWGLEIARADGVGSIYPTPRQPRALDWSPRWSPDGTRLAFLSNRLALEVGGSWQVYAMPADGSGTFFRVSVNVATAEQLVWSSDGRRLAYIGGFGNGFHRVHVADIEPLAAREVVSLDRGISTMAGVTWGPGDAFLVFAGKLDTGWDVFSVSPDGSGLRRLSRVGSVVPPAAAVSSDGKYVVFDADEGSGPDIYMARIDDAYVWRVTSNGKSSRPAWVGQR